MKTKYIASAALAAGISYNANAQKSDFSMYNTDFSTPNKGKVVNATPLKLNLDGTYIPRTKQFGAEASLQAHLGKNFWLGPSIATSFGKEEENSTKYFEKLTHVSGDLYTQTQKTTDTRTTRENPLELGLKFSKGFGQFEAGLGFGYSLVNQTLNESISGTDNTMMKLSNGEYTTLQEKPFTMEGNDSKTKAWNETLNAEFKWHPTRWSSIGVQGKYNLRDKRPEIMAKIGFQIGGKRRK